MNARRIASEAARRPSDRRPLGALVLLLLVTFAVYAPALGFGFVTWDDPYYVTGNAHVQGGLTPAGIAWAFTSYGLSNWHPLTWLSHMLDVSLFGLAPSGHHLTSVLLHVVNTLLLFVALRRLTGAAWRSLAVAALFALHPLHVESVAWVSERKDVLSTTFWMAALWAYAGWSERPSLTRYLGVVLAMALGLMAKQMLVSLPLTLLLFDAWPLRRVEGGGLRAWWPRLVEKLPLFALSAAASLLAMFTQGSGGAIADTPLATRGANALLGYYHYLEKTLWPAGLAAFYPYRLEPPLPEVVWKAAVLALISIGVWLGRRRGYLPAGWLWYLVTLLPVIGLVRIGQQAVADRYSYVPLIGVFVIAIWGLAELAERAPALGRRAVAAVVVAACVACALGTVRQVGTWQDSVTLWERAMAVGGASTIAHNNLGVALQDVGRVDDAVTQFSEAIRLEPRHARAHANLGNARFAQQRYPEAIAAYETAFRLDPGHPDVPLNLARTHFNLANATWREGRLAEALPGYREAVRWQPADAKYHRALAIALAESGNLDEAIDTLRATVRLDAADPVTHDALANALFRRGDLAGAWREVEECRRKGGTPSPALVAELARRMSDPR